jgi:hypothetical protein
MDRWAHRVVINSNNGATPPHRAGIIGKCCSPVAQTMTFL